MSFFGGKLTVKVKNCSIMFDNQMYLIIIWQLLPVSANFYLVFLFGVFDRLFDKIIDFEWSNAPLDWEIKFWNFIFPSHELIIDLEIVIRSFFDIAQIHQRSKGKIEPKYPHSPKYTHNTLCKRQVPFLTFSHPEQWFRWKFRNFSPLLMMKIFLWPMMKIFIVFEIWPIKLESLISFRWQNIGSVQQEKQKRRKSKQEIKSTKSNFKCILIWNPYLSFNLCFYNR